MFGHWACFLLVPCKKSGQSEILLDALRYDNSMEWSKFETDPVLKILEDQPYLIEITDSGKKKIKLCSYGFAWVILLGSALLHKAMAGRQDFIWLYLSNITLRNNFLGKLPGY